MSQRTIKRLVVLALALGLLAWWRDPVTDFLDRCTYWMVADDFHSLMEGIDGQDPTSKKLREAALRHHKLPPRSGTVLFIHAGTQYDTIADGYWELPAELRAPPFHGELADTIVFARTEKTFFEDPGAGGKAFRLRLWSFDRASGKLLGGYEVQAWEDPPGEGEPGYPDLAALVRKMPLPKGRRH